MHPDRSWQPSQEDRRIVRKTFWVLLGGLLGTSAMALTQTITEFALIFEEWTFKVTCNVTSCGPCQVGTFLRVSSMHVGSTETTQPSKWHNEAEFFLCMATSEVWRKHCSQVLEWSFGSWVVLGRMRWMARSLHSRARLFEDSEHEAVGSSYGCLFRDVIVRL